MSHELFDSTAENLIEKYQSSGYPCTECEHYDYCFGNKHICVKIAIEKKLAMISPREQTIIRMKLGFFNNKNFDDFEIAEQLSLTEAYTRQVIKKGF